MKRFLSFSVFCFLCVFLFCGPKVNSANKNTAIRCLKLAENSLVAEDWQNARNQAELGISYDNTISDLYYLKAASDINLGKTKAEVIETVKEAFQKDNWVDYTLQGARILLADLLCDTGSYEQSLALLDEEPFIYSADAEFIRIKNYYKLGTQDSINQARHKINSARRVYPTDDRLPMIFFKFELFIKQMTEFMGNEYSVPEIVQSISDSYINRLPDFTGRYPEMEVQACFFAKENLRNRLVPAINAKKPNKEALFALLALESGFMDQKQSTELFFNNMGDTIPFFLLEVFLKKITDASVLETIANKLADFNGFLTIDENYDLENEILVKYEAGRPRYIYYDSNNDGQRDLYGECDYGAPVFIDFTKNNISFWYSKYPNLSRISYTDKKYSFNFMDKDFATSPFVFVQEDFLAQEGLDFYIPKIKNDFIEPDFSEVFNDAYSIELPVSEREDAYVLYSMLNGQPVTASFFYGKELYAYCDFNMGLPFIRVVDKDEDGYFEISEFYNSNKSIKNLIEKDENTKHVKSIFSDLITENQIFLQKVEIDRNRDTLPEFSEEYLPDDGRNVFWDFNMDGIWDCNYKRYPKEENSPVKEETTYFDMKGEAKVVLSLYDGIPLKMIYKDLEVMIFSGKNSNFYWLNEQEPEVTERKILQQIPADFPQGKVILVELQNIMKFDDYKDNPENLKNENQILRYTLIKIGKDMFCHRIPSINLHLNGENDVIELFEGEF